MSEGLLVRRVRFRAVHRYGRRGASEEENRRRFGDQAGPHPHDWTATFEVAGPIAQDTGWCVDLSALDRAIARATAGWDGGDLNALVPAVAEGEIQPSCEELARWLHGAVAGGVEPPARLVSVSVFESPELGARWPAEGPGRDPDEGH